jgi:HSP20 family protein
MSHEMDRLLTTYRGPVGGRPDVYPPLNVYTDGESFIVHGEVPGIAPTELDIEVTGDTLTIRGERKAPEVPDGASHHRRERQFGRFRRSLTLPEQVDTAAVSASFTNGILEIRLPYAEATKRRKIDVTAS